MVGLVVDWDVWVEDDQSLVIVDLCEHRRASVRVHSPLACASVAYQRQQWLGVSHMYATAAVAHLW